VKISFDTTELDAAAERLKVLDTQTLREIRESTIDVVALSVRKAAVAETVKQLNVTQDYVETRIDRKKGKREVTRTSESLVSEVRGATLQRFIGSGLKHKPVKYDNSLILKITKKAGFRDGKAIGPKRKLPNGVVSKIWTERRGDKRRDIPAEMKSGGYEVDVNRKGAKTIATAFILPLLQGKQDGGNGWGVFQRPKGGGKPVHLYGPSVYQVFRRYAQEKQQDIIAEMQDTFLGKLDAQLSKI
jgi:hypothetical protein